MQGIGNRWCAGDEFGRRRRGGHGGVSRLSGCNSIDCRRGKAQLGRGAAQACARWGHGGLGGGKLVFV